jgi:hypothetical protein
MVAAIPLLPSTNDTAAYQAPISRPVIDFTVIPQWPVFEF